MPSKMCFVAWFGTALERSSCKRAELFPVEPLLKGVAGACEARDVTGLRAKMVLQDLSEIVQDHVSSLFAYGGAVQRISKYAIVGRDGRRVALNPDPDLDLDLDLDLR